MSSSANKSPVSADVQCRLITADPLRRRKAVLCEIPAPPPSTARAILLFGHGAKNPEWAAPFVAIRDAILTRDSCALVESGFLELMHPSFDEAVDNLVARGATAIVVVPVFMAAGMHVSKDLPQLAAQAMDRHANLEIALAPPVGAAPEVITAMADYALSAWR